MVDESTRDQSPSPGPDSPKQEQPQAPPPTPEQISVFMAGIGQKGGRIGGKRRLETMTAEQRKQSAKKAARARWLKMKKRTSNKHL